MQPLLCARLVARRRYEKARSHSLNIARLRLEKRRVFSGFFIWRGRVCSEAVLDRPPQPGPLKKRWNPPPNKRGGEKEDGEKKIAYGAIQQGAHLGYGAEEEAAPKSVEEMASTRGKKLPKARPGLGCCACHLLVRRVQDICFLERVAGRLGSIRGGE